MISIHLAMIFLCGTFDRVQSAPLKIEAANLRLPESIVHASRKLVRVEAVRGEVPNPLRSSKPPSPTYAVGLGGSRTRPRVAPRAVVFPEISEDCYRSHRELTDPPPVVNPSLPGRNIMRRWSALRPHPAWDVNLSI